MIDSTISAHQWYFPGAVSVTGGTTATPTAVYDTAGTYPFYHVVTAANGKSASGVRYAMFYDDAHPPITQFQLNGARADYETGGWEVDVTLFAEADRTGIRDRALCVLFAKDYFDGSLEDCPSPIVGNENVIACGWIAEENNVRNPFYGTTSMTVRGASYWLKQIMGFPAGLEMVTGTASVWTDMPQLTVKRYGWHLLHWRATATKVMDIFLTDDDRVASELNSLADSLWGQLTENSYTTIYASPGVDRYNRLWVEIEPLMEAVADRTWDVVTDLETQDWEGEIE